MSNASDRGSTPRLGASDVVIAVMGVTGSGKSTFISQLVRDDDVIVGHGLHSETKESRAYELKRPGQETIHIIDTPGFDDTLTSDADVLNDIAAFMASTYRSSVKLAGIIYLHRITDNRVSGSTVRYLRMFKELCGQDAYKHVVLVTSMWNKLHEMDEQAAIKREAQLVGESGFWKDMHERGSLVKRWYADVASTDDIIHGLLAARKSSDNMTLQIQRELVDEKKDLVTTSAGREVNRELIELQKRLKKEMRAIMEDSRSAIAEGDIRLHEELEKQRKDFEGHHQRALEGQKALQVTLQALLQENADKYRRAQELKEEELAAARRSIERLKAENARSEGKAKSPGQKKKTEVKTQKKNILRRAATGIASVLGTIVLALGIINNTQTAVAGFEGLVAGEGQSAADGEVADEGADDEIADEGADEVADEGADEVADEGADDEVADEGN